MAESTLSLSIDDLKAEIGHFLGYGRGTTFSEPAWTTVQTNNITAVLKSGLSQVYTPPPIRPGEASHNWSFLRPYASISITSGNATVALPDDFGGFEGPLKISSSSAMGRFWIIPVVNPALMEHYAQSQPDRTGQPMYAAEYVIGGTTATEGTRSNLKVFPIPDANYTLRAQYKVLQDALTGALPYPAGGSEHAELFKASVLAAAELQLDDMPGPRFAFFMQRLEASVHADRKRKGELVGYNGDRSDWRFSPEDVRRVYASPVTYNGSPL